MVQAAWFHHIPVHQVENCVLAWAQSGRHFFKVANRQNLEVSAANGCASVFRHNQPRSKDIFLLQQLKTNGGCSELRIPLFLTLSSNGMGGQKKGLEVEKRIRGVENKILRG